MRDQMSSFDIARLVLDIDELKGARCRKMYQPHYEQVVLRLNPKGKPNCDLVIVRGQRVYFSQRDRPMPKQPPQFAMLLRKYLSNARLTGASQLGFDRIIVLEFETKDGRRDLVIEMFRNGNVILLDEEGVITDIGRKMNQFPLEPQLSRTVLHAADLDCGEEAIGLVAMLSVPPPFTRPRQWAKAADKAHANFTSSYGDHITLLNAFDAYEAVCGGDAPLVSKELAIPAEDASLTQLVELTRRAVGGRARLARA